MGLIVSKINSWILEALFILKIILFVIEIKVWFVIENKMSHLFTEYFIENNK